MSDVSYKTACTNPECGSSDACVVYDDGHSFCFSCKELNTAAEVDAKPKEKKQVSKDFITSTKPRELKSRGIRLATCRKYGYEAGTVNQDILHVENFYKDGTLTAQHIRKVEDKDFYWIGDSKKVELFGQHLWGRDSGKRLVITEGAIDCMTIAQAMNLTWPVVSVPSGAASAAKYIKQEYEFVCKFDEIILAFDDDKAGHEAIETVMPLLPVGRVKVMKYDGYKDANELYMKSKRDAKAVVTQVYEAHPYRPDGIVSGKDILTRLKEKPAPGYDISYPILNEKLHGLSKKRFYLFTAGSGIGKSTLVHEIGYELVHTDDLTVGIFALEEDVREAALRHITIAVNRPMHLEEEIPDQEIAAYWDKLFSEGKYHFYEHFGSSEIDVIIEKMRYMIVALGCDFLIFDHISIVVSGLDEIGESERKMIDKFMTKARSLMEETGAGILAIVHLKRPKGNGKGFNEGRAVSLTDLRGSGGLEQMSDCVIALERDQQGKFENISRIRLLKNRKTGKNGVCDCLKYSHETGRLLVTDTNPWENKQEREAEDCGF